MSGETSLSRKLGALTIAVPLDAASVSRVVFIARSSWRIASVAANFEVASASGTVRPRKITAEATLAGAAAGATVVEETTAALSLSGTAGTAVVGTLSATASDRVLKPGDKLAVQLAGTLTGLAGGLLQIELQPTGKYGAS